MSDASESPRANREFAELIDQLRQGSDQAAWNLVEKYGQHIVRAVRRSLNREMRSKFDSQDFAQAVWASLFASPEKFHQLDSPAQLIGLLATMARNKVLDETRRRMATQKYNLQREQSIETLATAPRQQLAAREASPSEFAVAREQYDRLLDGQPEHYRQIIRLRLQGRTHRSIAQHLQLNEKTVRRVLERVMARSRVH